MANRYKEHIAATTLLFMYLCLNSGMLNALECPPAESVSSVEMRQSDNIAYEGTGDASAMEVRLRQHIVYYKYVGLTGNNMYTAIRNDRTPVKVTRLITANNAPSTLCTYMTDNRVEPLLKLTLYNEIFYSNNIVSK